MVFRIHARPIPDGFVVWGDTLRLEQKLVYRTGFNLNGGVIREIPLADCPEPVQQLAEEPKSNAASEQSDASPQSTNQLRLF